MKNHKIKIVGILAVAVIAGLFLGLRCHQRSEAQENQQGIAREIIRLHVIANSDSEEDQALKLEVKEAVLTYLRQEMQDVENVQEARRVIMQRLPEIEEAAEKKMREEGYDCGAEAELGQSYFPVKEYGDLTFPAGDYQALRVKLGNSQGRNWWCVMYPTLCFVDSTYQIVPEDSKEQLKTSLTEEEYNSLLDGGEQIQYSCRLVEWIENLKKHF